MSAVSDSGQDGIPARNRKLHPPLAGATLLYPHEQSFFDDDRKRLKGTSVGRGRLSERGRDCNILLVEYTAELVAVHDRDEEGVELPWQERRHELLGQVRHPDGSQISGVVNIRRRTSELIKEADGSLSALRGLVGGWEEMARTYPSEHDFVAASPRRIYPQHDYGFNWREGGCGFRLGFIPESGDVFAVLRSASGDGRRTEWLGLVDSKEELDRLLKPLWRLHGTRNSLARVRGALASVARNPTDAPRLRPSMLAA